MNHLNLHGLQVPNRFRDLYGTQSEGLRFFAQVVRKLKQYDIHALKISSIIEK